MKLQAKIWLGVSLVIVAIMATDLSLGYRRIEREIRAELANDSRIIRAILMATRRVYHQQFLASGLEVDDRTVGFLPAHALSRISADFPAWVETGLRFNNVSDRPRNPANRADADEHAAMDWFRANPQATERIVDIRDAAGRAFYHFTAPIWIEPYCLECHGERAAAPASISARYPDAYGYKLGELRGVMSIKVPLDELRAKAYRHWFQEFGLRLGGYAMLLLLLGMMLRRMVVRPLSNLTDAAQRLGAGAHDARVAVTGSDEVAALGRTFNTMADTLAERSGQIARLNQIYATLSQTNQTIVRLNDEGELLRRVCHISVDWGGQTMAWIGMHDPAGERIVVAAAAGQGLDYTDGLVIDVSATRAQPDGPSATAWRTGEPVIVQDFMNDPRTLPWQERARRFGWAASAAFPIRRGEQVRYVLSLYHTEAHSFDQRIQALLAEMAMDVGHALDRIDLIAAREAGHLALAASEAKYRKVLETTRDGFLLLDADGRIREANPAYAAMSGYDRNALLRMSIHDLEAVETPDEVAHRIRTVIERGSDLFETRHRTRAGADKVVEISISWTAGEPLEDGRFAVFVRDLSDRDEARERIERLAHFDTLTGLPNRVLMGDLARQAISQAEREHGTLALMFIDLDNFRHVNDTFGHRAGDALLIAMARRMSGVLRSEDVLARLGGDEFILLLPRADAATAAHVADRLLAACGDALVIEGHELLTTPSLGIALYPADGSDVDTLLRKADTATDRAKRDGRNTYRFFAPGMQQRSARLLQLEAAMARALERGEFLLHYQPQVDLASGRIVGIEALMRWPHPELGMISPAEFIPIAENSGLILPIGDWVIATALADLKTLMQRQLPVSQVAVNLSAVQFRQPGLVARIGELVAASGLTAANLELELTESLMADDPMAAIGVLDALHTRGVRLSIDDFGTGYSSLSYLKRFRIDKLKIDQSFVRDLPQDRENREIVRAVIRLAEVLGFRTIAEGVETDGQLALLRDDGCQEVQGYFFSRPLPLAALAEWLQAWVPGPR